MRNSRVLSHSGITDSCIRRRPGRSSRRHWVHIESAARDAVIRSAAWSSARQIRHHARISASDGGVRACSIREHFDSCHPAADSMWTQWRRLERPGLRRIQESVIPLWESTREFRIYSPFLIPGPVQTAAYIRALLKAVRDRRPNLVDDIEQAVEVRVATQHVTHEGDHRFTIVLEENVLRHQIGGPAVLREQLEYLRSAMSLPSVTLGIIPFSADRSLLHPVEMFFMHDDAQVNVELVSGWLRVTQPSEVEMYAQAFARLAEMAVYGNAARALVNEAIDTLG